MKINSLKKLVWVLLLIYVPILLIGALLNCQKEVLLVAFFVHILWHYTFLRKLNHWLWENQKFPLPRGSSEWAHAFTGLHHLRKRYRKRQKSLANVINRFREGSEALPDAVVIFAKTGEIIWCNRLAQLHLGFKWPADSGDKISNLVRHPEFFEYLKRDDFLEPLDLASPVNPEKILEFRIMPYAKGQRLLIVRDVTIYRQSDEMRRQFVANVSHELRTPLTVLQGYIEILEMQSMGNPQQAKTVEILDQQTKRMCSLVEQLMMLSKIEGATIVDLDQKVDVATLLVQIENEANTLGQDKGLSIVFDVEPDLHLVGDEMQIRSAMANLVYNAVNYTPAGGKVKVNWKSSAEGAYFDVIDNGDGIAAQHILHLTERFYRVDSSRSRDTGGSGLGLSIVKHTLNHYDSELLIDSTLGEGSKFSFIIPSSYVLRLNPSNS